MMHSMLRLRCATAGYFHRNGLLSQLMSVLLAWTMVMSSLPVYATDQPRAEWVHSLDVNAITKPATEPAPAQTSPADGYPPHDSKDSCIATPCDQSNRCGPSCSRSSATFWRSGL